MRTTKLFIVFALVALSTIHANAQKSSKDVERYIERYRGLAMSEQQRTGIPAAIKLAQGIHETGAGSSKLAQEANNHFGLKCKSNWTGATIMHTDDRRNECFRKYNLDFESYQDHSNYLASNPRYANLFNISVTDYAGWAFGLREAGYATNPKYAQQLIDLIENYRLQEYTYAAMSSNSAPNNNVAQRNNSYQQNTQPVQERRSTSSWQSNRGTAPANNGYTRNIHNTPPQRVSKYIDTKPNDRQTVVRTNRNGRTVEQPIDNTPSTVVKINNLKAIYGKRGDMPLQYAVRNGIRYEKFLEMNDLEDKPLPADMPLYLERKHFWGIRPMHLVKPYETLIEIAQLEGIQLKYLRDLNYLEPDEEPVPGVTLELQAQAGEKPKVVKKKEEPAYNPAAQQQDRYANTQPAQPVSTFPKNPAPPYEEEPNIIEKIKMAREARRREKEAQSTGRNITQNRPEPATSAPQYQPPAQQTPPAVAQQPVQQPQQQQQSYRQTTTQQPVQSSYSRQQYSYQNRNITPNPAANVVEEEKLSRKERRELRKKNENPYAGTAPHQPVQQPVQQQKPASELDKLKAQFDNVIYADNNAAANNRRQPTQQYQQPTQQQQPAYQQPRQNTQYGQQQPAYQQPRQNTQYGQQQPAYQQNNSTQYQNQYNSQYVEGGDENTDVDNQPQYNDPSKFYTMKPGDTAYTVAKKHGITIRQLMEMNDLDFDQIKEGANLRVKK